MIDQKIISVDTRGITRELVMRLSGEPYTRELGPIGQFFDNHWRDVFSIINNFYVTELSHGRDCNMHVVQSQIQSLVTTHLCRYFPHMDLNDMRSACQVFLEVLTSGYHARVPSGLGIWDSCVIKELNIDTYVVICSKQTNEPLPAAAAGGIFIQPINAPGVVQYG